MDSLFITLRLDLTNQTADGPGWYIQATMDGTPTVNPVSITPEAALEVAVALQKALQTTEGELPPVSLPQLAQSGSGFIRKALEQQLRHAEGQAAKVGKLRKKLAGLLVQEPTNG